MLTADSPSRYHHLRSQDGLQSRYSGEVPGPRRNNPMDTPQTITGSSSTASFEELAIPLLPSLLRQALWLTQDEAEAEDLAQETLSKALRAFSSFTPGTHFKAWIFRILRNTFLTSRTGIAAMRTTFLEDHEGFEESAIAAGPTPEETLIQLDDAATVQEALTELSPSLRDCLLLCDVEELQYKEIASILDVPVGTVMSRISRARAALRTHLQPHFGGRQ
jgi:RNA polymerase sigma-70 factor, ECF subfamily